MRSSRQQKRDSLEAAAWVVALRLKRFGYAEISHEMKIPMERATRIVRGWVAERSVTEVETEGARKMFRADADFVRIAGRTAEDNMWTIIRKNRAGLTPTGVAFEATTEDVPVSPDQAGEYMRTLLAAGYLAVPRKAAPLMKREAIYRLVIETGPLPPVVARVRALRDPNTGGIIVLGEPT